MVPAASEASPGPAIQAVERLTAEGLIGMTPAAKLYGTCREGRPCHPSTPTRHAVHGVRLPDGRILRLEAIRVAGRLMTSRQAVHRFFAAQNDTPSPDPPPAPRSPAARTRASAKAAAELDALGVRAG